MPFTASHNAQRTSDQMRRRNPAVRENAQKIQRRHRNPRDHQNISRRNRPKGITAALFRREEPHQRHECQLGCKTAPDTMRTSFRTAAQEEKHHVAEYHSRSGIKSGTEFCSQSRRITKGNRRQKDHMTGQISCRIQFQETGHQMEDIIKNISHIFHRLDLKRSIEETAHHLSDDNHSDQLRDHKKNISFEFSHHCNTLPLPNNKTSAPTRISR